MLFTFPSRYSFAIGLSGVFSLAGWSRRIRAEFLVLRVTQDTTRPHRASGTELSSSTVVLSRTFSSHSEYHGVVLLPRMCVATQAVWALPRSLATTGGIIRLFSLPPGTKMFQFPGFASARLRADNSPSDCWVVPFGNPRINGHLHLPEAYRSLSRPSSPPRAKASTGRPNLLSPMERIRHPPLLILSAVIEIQYQICSVADIYKVLLTVLCVNMSKISSRQKPSSCRAQDWLRLRYVYPVLWTVENNGFEPLTPCLQSRCSSQLS